MGSTRSSKRAHRPRPPYMQIFIDLLRKHNEQQQRYAPAAAAAAAAAVQQPVDPSGPPTQMALAASDRLKTRLIQMLAHTPAHKSVTQAAADSASISSNPQANAEASGSQRDIASGSQRDVISATAAPGTSRPGLSTLQAKGSKVPPVSQAPVSKNTTSEQFSARQPSAEQQPVGAANLWKSDETARLFTGLDQLKDQLERLKLEEINAILAQQRQNNLEQLQQLNQQVEQQEPSETQINKQQGQQQPPPPPPQQEAQRERQQERPAETRPAANLDKGKATMPAPHASPAARPMRTPALGKGLAKVATAKAAKDSNAPSLTQTPAAAVGGSSLVNQNAKLTLKQAANNKRISISKIIAEQTPNAFKTYVNVKNPGEQSGTHNNNNVKVTGNGSQLGGLEAVPSDYEHIFHFPSSMVDEPRATKVKYHERKDRHDNRQAAAKNAKNQTTAAAGADAKQNRKPKRQGGAGKQDNKKAR